MKHAVLARRGLWAAALTAAALFVAGCGHSAGSPAGARASAASAPAAVPRDGSPQTVGSVDDVSIQYRVYGHGEPAVVLIHGWAGDAGEWRNQLGALEAQYTVVTLDLAGHGASGDNRSDWSMGRYAADVAAVVSRIPNRRVILVGHAMGGPIALEATTRIGNRVIGVVGVDTFKSIGLPPPPRAQVDQQIEPFRSNFAAAMHHYVATELFAPKADPALVREVADHMARESPRIAIASLISLNELDYARILPSIHVPIIAIDSDRGLPVDAARIRKSAPTFHLVTLAGTGQFVMLTHPKRFNAALLSALDTIGAQAPTQAPTQTPAQASTT